VIFASVFFLLRRKCYNFSTVAQSYSLQSLEQLVEECQRTGGAGAFEELVIRTHRMVAATVAGTLRRWGSSDFSSLEDLVQEVYLKISVHRAGCLEGFESRHPGAILGYLRSTAVAVTHDYCKARTAIKRGSGLKLHALDECEPTAESSDAGGAASIEKDILLREIDKVLVEISPSKTARRDRLIFWLYYRQGFTAQAIAAIPLVALTVKGVEGVIQRLTRQVREKLCRSATSRKISAGTTYL
jgi:RNA polymerase sigma-70 factor (ECF subfamily)